MPYHPKACTLLYGVSCLLDAVDGMAARALNQTSKFGAVLDMVTDRCVSTFRRSLLLDMKVWREERESWLIDLDWNVGFFRCTTSCLLCFLAAGYPRYALLFQGLISLDFASHYIHMYS